MSDPRKTSSNLEYLGRQEPIDAEWTEVGPEPRVGNPKENTTSEFKAWASDTAAASVRMVQNALMVCGVLLVVVTLIALYESSKSGGQVSATGNEASTDASPVAEFDSDEQPTNSQDTVAGAATGGEYWPTLQPRPGKFFAYTLSEGRDFPLTVIVTGAAGNAPDDADLRSTVVTTVGNSLLGGAVVANTMIFDCHERMTSILQTVTASDLGGQHTKVYNADTMELKKLDAVTAPAFNMVCKNGWERLAEMVIDEKGLEAFVQARLHAIN